MESDWYVIRTNPQCEIKATGELRRAGVRVYLPKQTYEARNRATGVVTSKTRPLYVGYLFIRFQERPNWFEVRKCQGVKDVLCWCNEAGEWEPLAIPARIVGHVMQRQRSRDYDGVRIAREARRKKFRKGNIVRIADGPFKAFLAVIVGMKRNGEVEADIDVFGRPTRASFGEPDHFLREVA